MYDDNHRRHTIFYNFWLSCMAVAAHTLTVGGNLKKQLTTKNIQENEAIALSTLRIIRIEISFNTQSRKGDC